MTADPVTELFGRYEVRARIGEGSMGRVYRAFDPLAQREVCVKTPRPEILNEEGGADYVRRFEREARAAALLSHPHIVTVHDVGENYFVMELLSGVTLQRILAERGRLGLSEALPILQALADALDHAHGKGIVHRDVKPANVMILTDGRPKIMDFGVAHFESSVVTAKGEFLGSPSYMAPEQIAHGEATPRTDLFSLGVLAYEMLTGQRPFVGDSVTGVIYRVVNEEPAPPSRHTPELPASHDAVFARALSKAPSSRFGSARAFVDALAERRSADSGTFGAAASAADPGAAGPLAGHAEVETHDLVEAAGRKGWKARAGRPRLVAAGALVVALLGAAWAASARKPATAVMVIQTQPSGANVLVDGLRVGLSPVSLAKVTPGPHTVKVDRDGFESAEVGLELAAGADAQPVRFRLQPAAAFLSVSSQPVGSAVSIDDLLVGNTPLTSLRVGTGVHSVRVEREGFKAWSRAIEAHAGQEASLDAVLEPAAKGEAPQGRRGGWIGEGDLVEMGPGVKPPQRIQGAPAAYPRVAARLKLHGAVAVEMIITETGEVIEPRVEESAGEVLDQAVLDAVRSWRFEPARKDGVKVRVRYRYRQEFRP
jgi:TonB family protein